MPDTHFLGATPFGALENIPQAQAVKAKLLDTLVQQLFPKTGGQAQAPTSQALPSAPLPDPSMGGIVRGTPEPTQTPNALPIFPPDVPQQGNNAIWEFLKQMGIPIASTIAGVANPSFLPGAAGLNTGYASGFQSGQEFKLKKETAEVDKMDKKQKAEKEKWDDSYRTAIELSKTGAFGGIEPTSPQQLDNIAAEIYKLRYGSTKDLTEKLKKKYAGSPGTDFTSVEEAEN